MKTISRFSWCLLAIAGIAFPILFLSAKDQEKESGGLLSFGKRARFDGDNKDSKNAKRDIAAIETDDDEDSDDPDGARGEPKAIRTNLIGDYTSFSGLSPIVLEGVGLVVGLKGTGGDPAPSQYRTALMEELKKNGVPNPNTVLQSPNTALVIVKAYLPPLTAKRDKIDIEVYAPDSASVTSLKGGWLMETFLCEQTIVAGKGPLKDHIFAKASGAILTSGIGSDSKDDPQLLKRGRVLGGATILREKNLSLNLRSEFRSVRMTDRMAAVIGRRFHHFDEHGIKKSMAKPKTDQQIQLSVHPKYKDNYPRYLQVIRSIAFNESPTELRVRLERLKKEIFEPEKAEATALQLEAIGADAVPILKHGLTSPLLECRFHAATALAYLGNSDGLPALTEAVREERAFRVFALAAMSTLEDAETHIALRELMNENSAETRYGAFRALWTLDRNDPFIRGERLGIPEDIEVKKPRNLGDYTLHVLPTKNEPLVHVTLRTHPEVVLFGADQEFRAPMFVSAGPDIMVTAQPGASTVTLARFAVGKKDERRETSMKVADVIRIADEMGASYADIVQMLADASQQKNLPTRLAADELPEGGRTYRRPNSNAALPSSKRDAKIGKDNFTPNMFIELDDPDAQRIKRDSTPRDSKDESGKKPLDDGSSPSMANVPEQYPEPGDERSRKPDSKSGTSKKESAEKSPFKKNDSSKSEDDKSKSRFSWFGGSKK